MPGSPKRGKPVRVPNNPRSIRFPPGVERLAEAGAARQGIGFSEAVRVAVAAWATVIWVHDHPAEAEDLLNVFEAAKRALDEGRFDV